jgi:hypothetical protein
MPKAKEKPTADKQQEKIDATLKEAEKIKVKAKEVVDEIPDDPKDFGNEEPKEEPKKKVVKKEEPKEEPKEDPKPKDPDYKEKFINSTKEAQILHAKNKKITEALKEAKEVPEPTEKELKKEYSDWDVMGDFEKKMAKDAMKNSRRFNSLDKVTQEFTAIEEWNVTVDEFMADPANIAKNPLLEGKEAEFVAFVSKPTRRGVDFEDLTKAFLFDITVDEDGKKLPKKKGAMLPTGSGGDKTNKPKSDKLTVEQGRKLRMQDYGKWKKYLMANKIEEF